MTPAENQLNEEGIVLLNRENRKAVVRVAGEAHAPLLGRSRLAREVFSGRFQTRRSVQLREIAIAYGLDNESVTKAFAEFQAVGMVTLSGNSSATTKRRSLIPMDNCR